MSWVVIYLSRVTSAVGTWMVTCRDGVVDPDEPLVYASGAERGRAGATLTVAIGGLSPQALGLGPASAGDGPFLLEEDAEGVAPPVAKWLLSRGCVTRMLLACRHEGEIGAVIGFTDRPGGSGFSAAYSGILRKFGPVVAHGLTVARHLDESLDASPHVSLALLSTREAEVAALAAKGATNPEIASVLGLSPGTVKSHMHRVYAKLGVGSRTDLALVFGSIPADAIVPAVSPGSGPQPAEGSPDRSSR